MIRGEEERPDRWGQVVSEREREVARGRCWAAGTGEVGPGLGRFGRFRPVRPFPLFFLTATFFQFLFFKLEFKSTPNFLQKFEKILFE